MLKLLKNVADRYLNATYAFCLCMALTIGATYFAYRSSQAENVGRFERTVTNISNTLRNRMTVYINALLYTRNLFDIKEDLSRAEFRNFVQEMKLQDNFPGIQTMGYVERVTRSRAKVILKEMKKSVNYAQLAPDSNEIDLVVYYEQLMDTGNTAYILGKDLGTSPERKKTMNEARDLGIPVASERLLPLNTKAPPVYSFIVFMPRYKTGANISTVEKRRKALLGFVYAGFRAQTLFARVAGDMRMQNNNIAVRIYDGVGTDPNRIMYAEGDVENADRDLTRITEVRAANHTWTVEVLAPKNFGLTYLRWSPFFVLILGVMLSFAVMISLLKSDRLTARLETAREEADKANKAKSMFLANISHEIRTPLGVIIGFAESALTEDQKEQRNNYLNTILRNGNELSRIIGDVLDLSKIEAKTLLIEKNAFSLKKFHEQIKDIWQAQAENKGLSFYFEHKDDLPEFIESDEVRVKQILVNLLSNALKFTTEGSIRITTHRTPAILKENAEFLVYTVDDTGIGIREESRKKLFKAFSQEDSSITRKFGGSGLGLAISKELAQALGGDITIELNPQGRGSRFVFRIPLVASHASTHHYTTTQNDEALLKGKNILLVEDSFDNQMLISLIFKKFGVHLTTANNGREGVELALKNSYDLVLMDIQMPVMDGYAAFTELKENNYKVPVVALTAHALKEEREKALKMGFAAYLTKPIDRVQLVKTSGQLLNRPRKPDSTLTT